MRFSGLRGRTSRAPTALAQSMLDPPPERDQTLAAVFQIQQAGLLHIGDRGVGDRAVIDHAADTGGVQQGFQVGGQPQTVHPGVGDQHDTGDILLAQHGHDPLHPVDQRGFPVGQKGQRRAHDPLKSTAVDFFQSVHLTSSFPDTHIFV